MVPEQEGSSRTTRPFLARLQRPRKLSRTIKPDDMTLEEWQTELRRQYGRSQRFEHQNIGEHPVFSDFRVTNPQSNNTYRVAVRGFEPGDNYCSCADFATNTLGTCKHIEFMLGLLEEFPEAEQAFTQGFRPSYSEVFLKYGARREVCFRAGSDCPLELQALAGQYFEADRLRPQAYAAFDAFLAETKPFDHDLRVYQDALAFIAEVRDSQSRCRRIDEAFPDEASFEGLLKTTLYPYQRQGALFAARAGRVLLGDEMGLGKTVQALAAAEILARLSGVERVLIVCPTSLKHQWEREIQKFTDRSCSVVVGDLTRRNELYQERTFYKVVNYELIHRDVEQMRQWSPDLVILDEAQRIKNWRTQTAKSVKRIFSPYCVVLTGTPLENRLEELMSIVQFIDQHRLGPTFRFLHNHQITDKFGRVVGYRDLDKISETLSPILLRRRKRQVLTQLPPRIDHNLFVAMTKQQWTIHEENRSAVGRIVAKWQAHGFLAEADQQRMMAALQNMRRVCNSTYLIDPSTDHGEKADELCSLLDDLFEDPEAKAVVFSQWVGTHELLIKRLEKRKWDHVFFHGSIDSEKRAALIDRFRDDPNCRVFLSTDAGGVGLNLQHASTVVNMDLPWNPAVIEQRIGRVHRLGQEHPVHVVNLIARGGIEEGMLSVLGFKKSLFEGVLDGGEKEVFLGENRLQSFMETVETVTSSLPTFREDDDEPRRSKRPSLKPSDRSAETASSEHSSSSEASPSSEHSPSSAASSPVASPVSPAASPPASPTSPVSSSPPSSPTSSPPRSSPPASGSPSRPTSSDPATRSPPTPPRPSPVRSTPLPGPSSRSHDPRPATKPAPSPKLGSAGDDPWAGLLAAGARLLGDLAQAAEQQGSTQKESALDAPSAGPWIKAARDETTGEPCLQMPMPNPETLRKAVDAVAALLEELRRKS